MDQQLKQRLVGAAVLVALSVIVLPLFLDDGAEGPIGVTDALIPVQDDTGFQSRIVPLDQHDAQLPDPVSLKPPVDAGSPPVAAASEPPATPAISAKPASPAPAAQANKPPLTQAETDAGVRVGLSAWAVQLGSFSNAENALRLRDRLRGMGYPAFVETVYLDKGKNTRVFVGPELERSVADRNLERLEKDLSMQGMVVRYPGG